MGVLGTLRSRLFAVSRDTDVSDLTNPRKWLVNWAGGGQTTSGEFITPESAMRVAAYFACVRNLCEDLAKIPLCLYESVQPRGKRRITDHPMYALLHDAPNPRMTSFSFREVMYQYALSWGGGLAEIARDGSKVARELWPIHPSRILAHPGTMGAGIKWRIAIGDTAFGRDVGAGFVELDDADVIHIHGLGSRGIDGYSVASYAAQSLGIAMAAERFGAAFFGNGAFPSGIIEAPGKLDDKAKTNLRNSWTLLYGGAENSWRPAVLEGGYKFTAVGLPPGDAQFLETRQFAVDEIARWFRMPPHKIGQLTRATYNNIEHQSIEYVTDTMLPWLIRFEQEAMRKLFTDRERSTYFIEHVVQGLLRGDHVTRSAFYRTMVNVGALSPNDVRELENLNPIPAAKGGDEYFIQTNMTTLERAARGDVAPSPGTKPNPNNDGGEPPDDATEPGNPAGDPAEDVVKDPQESAQAHVEPLRIVVESEIARAVRRERNAVTRAIAGRDESKFRAWASSFYAEHAEIVASGLRSASLSAELLAESHGISATGAIVAAVEAVIAATFADSYTRARDVARADEATVAASMVREVWAAVSAAILRAASRSSTKGV